jgi:RHS repeat-associated protein
MICLEHENSDRSTTYYHTNGLGSVVAASNQAGELLWRKDYAPFGHQIDQTPDTEKLSYTGKPHDALLGLTNLGARYYDPHLGRFMSPDPVGFVESNPMSFNRYAYVNNNPYKYVDPDGEFLNFAAKFVLDVGVNVAFNYVTTGQMDVGGALKESAIGILNPAKTVAKVGKLAKVLAKTKSPKRLAKQRNSSGSRMKSSM